MSPIPLTAAGTNEKHDQHEWSRRQKSECRGRDGGEQVSGRDDAPASDPIRQRRRCGAAS
jgi:hypothetical protein